MKRHTVRQRLAAFLLAALMSLSWLTPLPAFAEDDADGIHETAFSGAALLYRIG